MATKLGFDMGDGKKGLSRKYIGEAVEASLRRLQTDYIDLYQAHTDDTETPLEETLAAFDELVKQGKVRAIGASNYTGARLKEAIEISQKNNLARYECLQPNYSLMERAAFESDLLPVVQEYGIGVIPYFSLAAGFLTGKYRSKQDAAGKARGPMVEKYLNDHGFAVLRRAGCSGSGVAFDAGACRPCVADREAGCYSADRQRHLARSSEGSGRGNSAEAAARSNRKAGCSQQSGAESSLKEGEVFAMGKHASRSPRFLIRCY